jgi:hypothetical protein
MKEMNFPLTPTPLPRSGGAGLPDPAHPIGTDYRSAVTATRNGTTSGVVPAA